MLLFFFSSVTKRTMAPTPTNNAKLTPIFCNVIELQTSEMARSTTFAHVFSAASTALATKIMGYAEWAFPDVSYIKRLAAMSTIGMWRANALRPCGMRTRGFTTAMKWLAWIICHAMVRHWSCTITVLFRSICIISWRGCASNGIVWYTPWPIAFCSNAPAGASSAKRWKCSRARCKRARTFSKRETCWPYRRAACTKPNSGTTTTNCCGKIV